MKYDVLLYTCENIYDTADGENDLIRVNGLSQSDVDTLTNILLPAGVNVCLLPYPEV